ncbi:N-acetylmuramoyl-L-alanine amidase [Patescibacteria group bacterium]
MTLILALVSADSTSPQVNEGRIIISEPNQNGSFFISANVSQNEIISPVIRTDFAFNSLYAQWEAEKANLSQDFIIYVKFLNENWSDWYELKIDDDINGKDNSQPILASQMIPTKATDSFQYKIVFDPHTENKDLSNLEFVYLNTDKGPKGNFKISANTSSNLTIISREEWGANENYKYDDEGNDLWEEEYYLPEKFVIHHTAGEKANVDPKATVRAIQYWHAVGREWGDIGYNFLIDSQGNIYEGRRGGDGVVAGHAYMRNRNTIGIAILGCYESETACNTPDNLTEAAKLSLNKLIAVKSQEFNIDPLAQTSFHGEILSNVIGHSDVGSTTCPGNLLYAQLPQTRQLAYNLIHELGGYQSPLPSSAQFVRQSVTEIDIEETKTAKIIVEYKNTGQAIWRGYQDAGVFITDSAIKNKLSAIGSVNIALNANYGDENLESFTLLGGNVYPGETGRFVLTLSPPTKEKTTTKDYTLALQNKGYFPNSDFAVTINRIPCYSCQQAQENNSLNPTYKLSLLQSTFPEELPAEDFVPVVVEFQNIGNQQLNQDNLKLHIVYADEHVSPFRNSSWYNEYASIPPAQDIIYPNKTARFEFKVKAPNVVAPFPHTLSIYYNDQVIYQFDKTINVVSAYASEITANTIPVAVLTSWRPTVKLTFKNTGTKTWDNPILKSYDIDYTNSWFRDWSWHDNKTIEKTWQNVEPGEELTFIFKIKPYWKRNTYPHVYKLFDGDEEIHIDGKTEYLIYTRVD